MSRRPCTEVVQLWDGRHVPGRVEDGLLTFGFRGAPEDLATFRQLRMAGLRPGGHGPVAQIKWRRGHRWAALYRVDLAVPVRPMTDAKRAAIEWALAARRFCRIHGDYVDHYVRGPNRQCSACFQSDPETGE